jgi:hypothetical protein
LLNGILHFDIDDPVINEEWDMCTADHAPGWLASFGTTAGWTDTGFRYSTEADNDEREKLVGVMLAFAEHHNFSFNRKWSGKDRQV